MSGIPKIVTRDSIGVSLDEPIFNFVEDTGARHKCWMAALSDPRYRPVMAATLNLPKKIKREDHWLTLGNITEPECSTVAAPAIPAEEPDVLESVAPSGLLVLPPTGR